MSVGQGEHGLGVTGQEREVSPDQREIPRQIFSLVEVQGGSESFAQFKQLLLGVGGKVQASVVVLILSVHLVQCILCGLPEICIISVSSNQQKQLIQVLANRKTVSPDVAVLIHREDNGRVQEVSPAPLQAVNQSEFSIQNT